MKKKSLESALVGFVIGLFTVSWIVRKLTLPRFSFLSPACTHFTLHIPRVSSKRKRYMHIHAHVKTKKPAMGESKRNPSKESTENKISDIPLRQKLLSHVKTLFSIPAQGAAFPSTFSSSFWLLLLLLLFLGSVLGTTGEFDTYLGGPFGVVVLFFVLAGPIVWILPTFLLLWRTRILLLLWSFCCWMVVGGHHP